MQKVLDISLEDILVDKDVAVSERDSSELKKMADRVIQGEPIQYILQSGHFFGREFYVDKNVLIPRQETEELVNEIVIDNPGSGYSILDIGAGSGCIGVSLALEMNNVSVVCLDIDKKALDVVKKNADRFGVEVKVVNADILGKCTLSDSYDIIVSNPPYVTTKEKKEMRTNVLVYEPEKALFVDDDNPLIYYHKIIKLSGSALKPGGKLYFEINEHYGAEMIKMCEEANCSSVRLLKDLNGKDRIVKAAF